nr:hypothetical protein CFP56_02770 [Quercus suber]
MPILEFGQWETPHCFSVGVGRSGMLGVQIFDRFVAAPNAMLERYQTNTDKGKRVKREIRLVWGGRSSHGRGSIVVSVEVTILEDAQAFKMISSNPDQQCFDG